jgi:hypothetical protein
MTRRHAISRAVRVWTCWVGLAALSVAGVSAQTVRFTPLSSIPGPAELIRTQGGYLYVAAARTITIFDVSNPATPKQVGAYTFPLQIWGFRAAGSLLYVAADLFGLGILDVSNPASPKLLGSFKTPGQAKNVAVSGTRVLITDHISGLDVIDVSNPTQPVFVGSVFLEGFATDVVTSGALAYVGDRPTGFYVFDLSKPPPLEPVSALQSVTGSTFQLEVLQTFSQGPTFAVLMTGVPMSGAWLQLYDVSNPEAPVHAATYRTPGGGGWVPGGGGRLSLKGTLAYVADGKEGLQVVDLSTPSAPRIVGSYETSAPARDVAVADSLVFVVVGNQEVLILRQT